MSSDLISRIDERLRGGALQIAQTLRESGYEALFAGGAVRDLLMGRRPTDVDIATSAPPDVVESLFDKTIPVGKQFGAIVVLIDHSPYEVTTFRREGGYVDGRHPGEVSFTDSREDALRRDFTVNALFLDPFSGEILDYVGGRDDLAVGVLRTVGRPGDRFKEDKLRILRAVRFACQLSFEMEAETWEAVRQFAPKLLEVSWERIRDELLRILTGPDPEHGLQLLHELRLLEVILPEVEAMVGVEQPPQFHPEGDVFTHTKLMFRLAQSLSPELALGILLHDVGKPPTFTIRDRIRFDGHAELGAEMAERICHRLKLSNQQTENVVDLVRDHLRFIHVAEMRESTLKRFLRKENFEDHLELHRLDCLGSHGDLSSWRFCRQKLDELRSEQIRPKPFLDGHDLIGAGLKPGPIFSEILRELEDLQLENRLQSREEALNWLQTRISDPA